jgi:uncharacterized membrane protein YecN with MAPEG domain
MPIVPLYAALLALIFVALSLRTIRLRQRLRVAIGDGGDERLRRAARAHSNFAEYVPLALLLLFFVETAGASRVFVHALCASLLLGRLVHALGVSRVREPLALRATGIVLTFVPIVAAAVRLLATSFSH